MIIKSKCGDGTVRKTMIVVNGEDETLPLNTLYVCSGSVDVAILWYTRHTHSA